MDPHPRGGASNPVLLLIQQGPGLPMINEARRFEHLLGLEQAFTVVYWDQRGCGRSLRGQHETGPASAWRRWQATPSRSWITSGTDSAGRPTSPGSLSERRSARSPPRSARTSSATLVATGMDIDGAAAGTGAYDFALRTARQRGNRRATRQLEAIGPPPHLSSKQFATRVRWATNFGGVTTGETYATLARGLVDQPGALARLLGRGRHPDRPRYHRDPGRAAARAGHHGPDPHLPRLDVPVVMVQGRLDQVAPGESAQQYASSLQAPGKRLVWFETSAHTPHLDEPAKFRDVMLGIRDSQLAST